MKKGVTLPHSVYTVYFYLHVVFVVDGKTPLIFISMLEGFHIFVMCACVLVHAAISYKFPTDFQLLDSKCCVSVIREQINFTGQMNVVFL
jgi:hypothetical protein